MSFAAMLNHKCDVYHIQKSGASPGFGLPASPLFSYPDTPDIEGQVCHFGISHSVAAAVSQQSPYAVYDTQTKLTLPLGADIRLNDKVIDVSNGIDYIAAVPAQIWAHHVVVMLRRTDAQKPIGAADKGHD